MNSVGIRLREERNKLGLSQEKLAEVGGVQKLAQTNYETGKRSPTGEYLVKIAELGADVNYILTGVRMAKPESEPKKETVLTGEGTMLKGGGGAANEANMSPKRKKMFELLERLDDDALDDAIYSTKKLVENSEMKREFAQFRQMISQQQVAA